MAKIESDGAGEIGEGILRKAVELLQIEERFFLDPKPTADDPSRFIHKERSNFHKRSATLRMLVQAQYAEAIGEAVRTFNADPTREHLQELTKAVLALPVIVEARTLQSLPFDEERGTKFAYDAAVLVSQLTSMGTLGLTEEAQDRDLVKEDMQLRKHKDNT